MFRCYTLVVMDRLIHGKLQSIVDKLLFLEKRNIFEYQGTRLFPSEIHLMLAVHKEGRRARNATRIARQLGITKGAVSQSLSRLIKKGILAKTKDPASKNELTLTFTNAGKQALKQLLKWKDKLSEEHNKLLNSFSEQDKGAILRFLTRLEQALIDGHS